MIIPTIIKADVVTPYKYLYSRTVLDNLISAWENHMKRGGRIKALFELFGTTEAIIEEDGVDPDDVADKEKLGFKVDRLFLDEGTLMCQVIVLDTPVGMGIRDFFRREGKLVGIPDGDGFIRENAEGIKIVEGFYFDIIGVRPTDDSPIKEITPMYVTDLCGGKA